MQASINLLTMGLYLLCLVDPLRSDPQQTYWTNYDPYNPIDHRSLPLEPVEIFSEQYSSNLRSLPPHETQIEEKPQIIHAPNHFQASSSSLSYPVRTPSTNYRRYHDLVPRDYAEASKKDRITIGDNLNEEEITKKMRILDNVLSEDSNRKDYLDTNGIEDKIIPEESRRVARQVRKQKPGFFWTLARITFETINDTRSAIKQISTIINNSIAPDSATQSTMTSGALTSIDSTSSGTNMTTVNATETTTTSPMRTTEAPYVLTRTTLQSLIRRNVLGLVKLFNLEWKEALNVR
ncbi:hypothetical protein WH47_00059 [Habropoda laboriosa]|uniref:Uncharacterized protein n=1 Tax=Habropoda laboriosa TaxID=597456 RepID=A0A0L7RK27_9HYME|nr:hypothetical protein WH47_00059 [Habropoda laboriosa]